MADDEKPWKRRSAKTQVNESDLPSTIPSQAGLTFNVWYNKWSQGYSGNQRFVNPFRLEPIAHSGITLGDKSGNASFCIYFAKGMCATGKKCRYKHHVPDDDDALQLAAISNTRDCFGREKFAEYRDDMGGVGSFNDKNSTLYIGGISGALNNKEIKSSQIESRLRFLFCRLGSVEKIQYLESKKCGFIKFKNQCNAEFAKEAMANQTLLIPSDKEWDERKEGTGLLIKWANENPNLISRNSDQNIRNFSQTMTTLAVEEDALSTEKRRLAIEEAENATLFNDELLDKIKKRRIITKKPDSLKNENSSSLVNISQTTSISSTLAEYGSSSDDD